MYKILRRFFCKREKQIDTHHSNVLSRQSRIMNSNYSESQSSVNSKLTPLSKTPKITKPSSWPC
jgi:hypothetical protein